MWSGSFSTYPRTEMSCKSVEQIAAETDILVVERFRCMK